MSWRNEGPETWLRRTIEAELGQARYVIAPCGDDCVQPCGFHPAAGAVWEETTSGVLDIGTTGAGDTWHGVWAMGDSRVTRFIAENDPQSRIADCEAKLAILDLYEKQSAKEFESSLEEDRTWVLGAAVRLLASGYRHSPGYEEAWGQREVTR